MTLSGGYSFHKVKHDWFNSDGDVTAGHANRVFALKFSKENPNVLISGGWDSTIQVDAPVLYSHCADLGHSK
jgi:hypothetical protein